MICKCRVNDSIRTLKQPVRFFPPNTELLCKRMVWSWLLFVCSNNSVHRHVHIGFFVSFFLLKNTFLVSIM